MIVDQNIEKYKIWQPLLLGLCAVIGLWAGLHMRQPVRTGVQTAQELNGQSDQFQKIKDVLSYVQSKYIDTIDPNVLTDIALGSFLSNLDPYSEYIPADLMHQYSDQIQGKMRGIGIDLVDIDSQLVISQLRPKSPAANAGISVGDYILEIDNHPAKDIQMNPDSIHDVIENHESDSILIKWKNRIQNQIKQEKIPIAELEEHAVTDVYTPDKQILYLRLNQLSKDSYREFMKAIEPYFEFGQCKHLIIDLRNNSGGLVHEAAYILNQLINEKEVLMFKTKGNKVKDKEFNSTGKPFFRIEKIAVLVNGATASAAELMAAALQDLDRAIIIGSPTFGKATVLEQFSLSDGSAIRLAVSRYYTNSGRSIQKDYEHSFNVAYLGHAGNDKDSVFYSPKKKKLVSHRGVIPEILIQGLESNDKQMPSSEMADKIIGKHFLEFKTLLQNNPDNIIRNEKIRNQINEEIQNLSMHADSVIQKEELQDECSFALARWFFGEGFEWRMRLLKDKCLEAAIEKLKN